VAFTETIAHVDMDAFFVEVERRRDPALREVPVIVGGLGRRGVVASASYEARERGVRSAMPIGEARRLCPRGRFLPPRHERYAAASTELFDVLRSTTPRVEGLSVDEAFLDIGGLRLHFESPEAVGAALRSRIREMLGLPASVGISRVKFISKLASAAAKPDGLVLVAAGKELDFLHPMPVRRLWGVGEATRAALEALGVATIGDLAAVPEPLLRRRVGAAAARHLSRLAVGVDAREVEPDGDAKSISVEETFEADLVDDAAIATAVLRLCDRLASRVHRANCAALTVTLKLRYGDFETVTRATTVPIPIHGTPAFWDCARRLLDRLEVTPARGVRLLGVGASGLVDAVEPRQLTLDAGGREAAGVVVEEVRDRFGHDAVMPASLLEPGGTSPTPG
jgi:DNA polymerase-4